MLRKSEEDAREVPHPKGSPTTRKATSSSVAPSRIASASCSKHIMMKWPIYKPSKVAASISTIAGMLNLRSEAEWVEDDTKVIQMHQWTHMWEGCSMSDHLLTQPSLCLPQ